MMAAPQPNIDEEYHDLPRGVYPEFVTSCRRSSELLLVDFVTTRLPLKDCCKPAAVTSRAKSDWENCVGLYKKWCKATKEEDKRKRYWTYVEKDGGRDKIRGDLGERVRSHYDRLERIASDVERLGYRIAAKILRAEMPQTATGRSGDLGEILATELVEEEIGLRVPVRRLRYKDGRNMAMRGDDFIGAGYDVADEKLWLLKGEAKSNITLNKSTVTSARNVLNRDNGRCTPDSLLFVANRLLESKEEDDNELGRTIRDEVGLKSLRADRIDHMLFTVSGNGPHASLRADLNEASINRDQYVVNIHVADHQNFIAEIYTEAEDLGDD